MSDSTIGKAVIEVSADSRKLTAGIEDAKRSLKSLGVAAGDATKGQSQSIDRYVKSLGVAAVTTGKTARELELYKLALRGASAEQLKAADSALRMSEAYAKGEKIGEQIKTGLLTIGTLAATGLIAAYVAFDQLVKKAGDFQDMAEKTGDTAQNMASLAVAAGTAGVGMADVTTFAIKLTKNLTGVDDESKAAGAAITALGLDMTAFKNLKSADQIEAIAQALNKFQEGAGKTAVLEALSKGGAQLLPFLKELGAEGGRQVILTQEQITQADAYADKQAKLRTEMGLHAQAIAIGLTPTYNDLAGALLDVSKEFIGVNKEATSLSQNSGIKEWGDSVADKFAFIADSVSSSTIAFKLAGESIGGLMARWAAMPKTNAGWAELSFDKSKGDAYRAQMKSIADSQEEAQNKIAASASTFRDALEKRRAASKNMISDAVGVTKPDLKFDGKEAKASGKSSSLKEERDAARELKKAYDELMKAAMARSIARNAEYTSINDYLLAEERARIGTVKAANDAVRAAQDEYDNFGKTKSQIAEVTLARLNDKLQAVNAGSTIAASIEAEIDAQKRLIAIMQKGESRDTTNKALADQKKANDDYVSTLHNDVKNALSTAFRDTKDPIGAFGDALGNVIYTRVTNSIADAMAKQIIDSSIGTGIASMLGMSTIFGGVGKASGGAVAAGSMYQVNENGPELLKVAGKQYLMMGTKDGSVTPNGGSAASQPPLTIQISAVVGDVASKSDVVAGMRSVANQIATTVQRSRGYGGALS